MDAATLTFAMIVVLMGAFVRGYSGFGSSLLWVSGLSLVLRPVEVVPTIFLLEITASIHLLPKVWREIDWRSLRWLLLGTFAATPFGIVVLASLPPAPMRMGIALVVLTATALMWRGFSLKATPGPGPTVLTGLVCGALNGSTGIGGPPAILFYFSSPAAAAVSRASLIAFLFAIDAFGATVAAVQGLVTGNVLLLAALLLLPVVIGVATGNRRFIRTEPETFRRFVLLLLALFSVAVLLRVAMDF